MEQGKRNWWQERLGLRFDQASLWNKDGTTWYYAATVANSAIREGVNACAHRLGFTEIDVQACMAYAIAHADHPDKTPRQLLGLDESPAPQPELDQSAFARSVRGRVEGWRAAHSPAIKTQDNAKVALVSAMAKAVRAIESTEVPMDVAEGAREQARYSLVHLAAECEWIAEGLGLTSGEGAG